MSRHKPLFRNPVLLITACAALSMAVVRCSPLALSTSKLRSAPKSGSSSGPTFTGSGSNPSSASEVAQSAAAPVLTGVTASVSEFNDFLVDSDALPSGQKLVLTSEKNGEALDTFKQTRSLTLHFAGQVPDSCKAYLGLSMSETSISNYGWNNGGISAITTDCVAQPDGNWKISISANVPQDAWNMIANSLQGLTIFVSNNPQMSLVSHLSAQAETGTTSR
jgi:hypothetical protein